MSIIPLFGHEALRARLAELADQGTLPATILLQGPAGIGKQRLALWLGQLLLCEAERKPCGSCQHCRLAETLQHPDLRWCFPQTRLTGERPDPDEVDEVILAEIAERRDAHGLYERPDGTKGIYQYVAPLLVQLAAKSPSLAHRKVFVIGDAERMVPQASSPEMANAMLKLLEEPPANTTFILTSSEPGTLLPTIRSRTVSFRVPPLSEAGVRTFLADSRVAAVVPNEPADTLVRLAGGAPGTLIGDGTGEKSVTRARQILAAADGGREALFTTAFSMGSAGARGAFSDTLDALSVLLHEQAREATARGDASRAAWAVRAIPAVEDAKRAAEGNANPQLVTARLLTTLAGAH